MTLQGAASDFLGRVLRQRPDIPWPALRNQLREQFSDTGDALIAKQKLIRLRQCKDESIHNYAERLFSLAEEAYTAIDLNTDIVQRQLVEILTAGLKDDRIARKLLREQPADLAQAVRLTATEFQTSKCFELCRRVEEPMDVSAVASSDKTTLNDIKDLNGELEILAAELKNVTHPKTEWQSPPRQRQMNMKSHPHHKQAAWRNFPPHGKSDWHSPRY